ncbi:serine/threonine-protein kinase Nek1-like [Saccoglossus kowalevskii]|uniref:non-specific serine/threonine protein kinase n=1 Tax=Saccoglossus kowalevskii TaxID=10224 RepID=A0ABM0MBE3_SACKO|nr:PREDICTED: serine/threonine-protein kinase Nek1-like [Saccoglossus kowalevskii]
MLNGGTGVRVFSSLLFLIRIDYRDRPSITTILKKPFLQKRIEQFLSDAQISDEFSHTVLHRNRPALAARPPVQAVARKPPSNQLRISDPAAKYGVPLARRPVPAAAKRQPIRRSGDNRPKKPPSVPNDSKELERKKKELIEKENARQEKDRQIRQHHIQLLEKQRKARIDKAKEEGGWRNLLDSGSSGGSGGGGGGGGSGSSAGNNNRNGAAPRLDARPDQVKYKFVIFRQAVAVIILVKRSIYLFVLHLSLYIMAYGQWY